MKRLAAAAALAVLAILATGAAWRWLVGARMADADRLLRQVSDADGNTATLGIVVRLELVRRRQQLGEDRVENYELEARLQSIISATAVAASEAPAGRLRDRVAQAAFDVSRALVRGEAPANAPPTAFTRLEEAYLWERGRRYRRAVELYDRLLAEEQRLPPAIRERVQLHRAFCLAMAGDYAAARTLCDYLAGAATLEETASAARRMARILVGIETRHVEIARDALAGLAPVDQGRELYLAMDYRSAVGVLRAWLGRRGGDPRAVEARYFLARSLEELGADAADEYRRVMMLDPDGPWARDANRRLAMIGAFYGGNQELGESATRRLARMGDKAFVDAVEPYRELVEPEPALAAVPRDPVDARPPDRGELFVQTTPAGAQVIVNGVDMGASPVFVTDLPFGKSVVRAVAGTHWGEITVDVEQSDIMPVILTLASPTGSIRVEAPFDAVEVFVDDVRAGPAELRAVAPGKRVVLVRAVDRSGRVLLWEREIEVKAGETAVVRVP